MHNSTLGRRAVLGAALLLPLMACGRAPSPPAASPPAPAPGPAASDRLAELETRFDARLGLYAVHTGTGRELAHRADERFPLCSTFKVLAVAAMLAKTPPEHLQTRIRYGASEVVENSPVTEGHVADGLTVAELCDAAIRYSDNTAGNLLLDDIGGPGAVTDYARLLGDGVTRLDRRETELNSAIPGDDRDTTSPRAIAGNLRDLVLGDRLDPADRALLTDWLVRNTTGGARIRAGLPPDWRVADKTGSGSYGTANDIAVAWPPGGAPIVLAVLSTRDGREEQADNALIAQAAAITAAELR
ncbi:class A beta-lactamase BlaC [Pseudonocardia yunnanensis]|uniref:Beta-lactamase n=1 Tax=Pseudonocardia yunnanensis TaxID=58107 RepID=A0ABW4F0J7_9PSEU